jgi:hypothetical protein
MIFSRVRRGPFFLAPCILFTFLAANAQENPVPARVAQAVNEQVRVALRGNTHPLARAENDRGLAPDDLPLRRMLLLLKRSPEQQLSLAKLLDEQQDKSSANYHHWLTPEEFGERFGPADEDIQAVTDWLGSQGLQVNKVAAGRTVIEFSGTAGEVRAALRTPMHRYSVQGKSYWANASDPQIPAALAPVVAGVVSLNNFPRQPLMHSLGAFARSKQTGQIEPLYTLPYYGTNYYILGPYDFAEVYNVLPLWDSGIDGSGVAIAVVAETNINLADAADFRAMWGLPPNPPQIILNGPDPGIVPGDESEAATDVQWAGAVAKGATIDLVVSESTETSFGTDLSSLYIIDNNIAPIMSVSYGACEQSLGTAGNAFYSSLYQQGAAEGITILVASGDSGSDTCDFATGSDYATTGLSVNGLASTPFNVAVGGTDFNDASNPSTYWSSTNDSVTQSSAKSYIPEDTWNSSCARTGLRGCYTLAGNGLDLLAAGGGPSDCSTLDASGACVSGYAKPAWQTGPGVPSDGVRDLPDVSVFAAVSTVSNSFYPYCQQDVIGAACGFYSGFLGAGGTSISAQAFAGVMALVVQRNGGARQGNANYVFYPLAAQSGTSCNSDSTAVSQTSCAFYDTSVGNISVACLAGSPNCSNTTTSGHGILVDPNSTTTPAWTTTPGYDRATGLGTVNVANLANQWSSVGFGPTTTTLSLSTATQTSPPITLTHGQPVSFNISVTSDSGTPTGAVSLLGSPNNASHGIDFATLSGGAASGSTIFLPGGSYGVTAHYAGDGKFGSSNSTPVQVTVNPESSLTKVGLVTFDYNTGYETSANATTAPYGSPYLLRVDVTNASGKLCAPQSLSLQYACPTGNVALTDNGAPLDLGNYSLNSQGYLEDQPIQLSGGPHTIAANYAGDASYKPSQGGTSVLITPLAAQIFAPQVTSLQVPVNSTIALSTQVYVTGQDSGAPPTGTVTFYSDGVQLPGNVVLTPTRAGACPLYPWNPCLLATLSTSLSTSGTHVLTAVYGGDANYLGATSTGQTVFAVYTPVATLTLTPSIVAAGGSVKATALVDTTNTNLPPTGYVCFTNSGCASLTPTTDSNGYSAAQASVTFTAAQSLAMNASYSGDSNYASAQSTDVDLYMFPAGASSDFSLQMQSQSVTIIGTGHSASTSLTLIPAPGTTAVVALSCTIPKSMAEAGCSFSPSLVSLTDGTVSTAQLTITTTAGHTDASVGRGQAPSQPSGIEAVIAAILFLVLLGLGRRRRLVFVAILIVFLIAGSPGCGGNGSNGGGGGGGIMDPGTPPGTYNITVTGTATINGATVSHNVTINVLVR